MPLVSVVIPVFNGERFLAAAIRSVLDQTHSPVELIVVDDGSTDGSAALARSFEGVRVIEQAHGGPGAARNRGVAAAGGELLTFLDADDLMPAGRLALQVEHLSAHPEAGAVLGRQELLLEPGVERPPWAELESMQPLSLMLRRAVFDAVGEFGHELGEDVDWLCRVYGAGVRVDTIDAVVVRRRVHEHNLTHDVAGSRLAMFRALRDHAARSRAAAPAPLVSVVIPVFNGERFLAAAIRSVLDQTHSPVELIVVDDGSTDASAAVARSFEGVMVIEQAHGGPGAARNRGVAAASGELLAFLDADDLMPADKLERQVGYLREHPDVGCVLGLQELVIEPGVEKPRWAEAGEAPLMSMVAPAALFDRVGGFDTTYLHGEDADWLLRAREHASVATIDSVVLHRRVHSHNLSNDEVALRRATFRVLRDHMRRRRAADGTAPQDGDSA
jgi:glycosyltransferase involved in cell wall biosynthesis